MDKFCIPIEKPETCEDCPHYAESATLFGYILKCSITGNLVIGDAHPPADCPIVPMPDVDDTPPLDRALEAIEAVYQNHPNDKLTAFLILRYTVEERINDIKDESEASNG